MTSAKKILVTIAIAVAAVGGAAASASAGDIHATTTPVTTDNVHVTGVAE